MKKLNEVNLEALLYLFKGEPGTRKSTQALSFPTPQYWFSTDRKMNALSLPAKLWGVDTNQIEYDDFIDWDAPKNQLKKLKNKCPYKTIIVDSITSSGDCINDQTLTAPRPKDEKEKGITIGGIKVGSFSDYKAESRAFVTLIRELQEIRDYHKVNIILIAHVIGQRSDKEVSVTSQSRVIVTGGKSISGKISAYAEEAYHFNAVQRMGKDVANYEILTQHTGGDYARTTLGLEPRIQFDDKPLWSAVIKPAIDSFAHSST